MGQPELDGLAREKSLAEIDVEKAQHPRRAKADKFLDGPLRNRISLGERSGANRGERGREFFQFIGQFDKIPGGGVFNHVGGLAFLDGDAHEAGRMGGVALDEFGRKFSLRQRLGQSVAVGVPAQARNDPRSSELPASKLEKLRQARSQVSCKASSAS